MDQNLQEETSIERIRQISHVVEIEKKVMMDELIISPDILDTKGDRYKGWGINEKRGGEAYIPPLDGWVGIGLNVWNKYGNNNWLSYRNVEGEYSIAYYGLNNYLNDKGTMINELQYFISDITKVIDEREYQKENDKRSGFLEFFRDPCGGGVCLFQDPKIAEHCAGIINLFGTDYKILLMCRVNPKKIRQPVDHDKFWILNPTPDEIRPYRILLKKVLNSPLLDNELITYTSPVDYIMNAINSKNFDFYQLKTTNRFNNKITHEIINGKIGPLVEDDIFIIKYYSSECYRPLNKYMFNKEISTTSPFGFEQKELDSAICCLQNVLKKYVNVENDTIVYRGITNKFPDNINVGSQFYFSSFVSTSTSKEIARRFIKSKNGTFMTITIRNNGTDERHPNYCLNIEKISLLPEEKEILLCSHCYFQVTNIQRNEKIDYVDLLCKGYLLDNYENS